MACTPGSWNIDPNRPAAGCDRITVSGAFFGSPDSKDKGSTSIDFYAWHLIGAAVQEFSVDLASITGSDSGGSKAKRAAFANNFAQRSEFTTAYGPRLTQLVNALMTAVWAELQLTSIRR